MIQISNRYLFGAIGAVLSLMPAHVHAVTLDLTEVSSGSINGAIYSKVNSEGTTGSGSFSEFVSVQSNDIEAGYNSSGAQQLDAVSGYNVLFSDLVLKTIGGTDYYEFVLNIREPNDQPIVIIDQLRIYTSSTGSQTTTDVTDPSPLGVLRYDQGSGNEVYVDQSSTTTSADMFFYVPASNFAGVSGTDYVYLYSQFYSGGGDAESWALDDASLVPEADTWVAATLCLLIPLGSWAVRRRRRLAQAG